MEALAAFAPAVAEVDILMDMGLIEIDQVMALIARAIQQRADLGNKSLPLVGIGASEQLASFLPGQVQPVQGAADGLAAEAAGGLRLHKTKQTPPRPPRVFLRSPRRRPGPPRLGGAEPAA